MAVPVKKYKAILLEEGLGNLGTCFYYTRQALESAVDLKLFEGKKCYADHPDAIEEKTRPERSVRDVIGHFESVEIENGQAGQALLVGTLVMPQSPTLDWARVMVESAIDNSGRFDSELIGLSINASGISEEKSLESFMSESNIPISAQPKLEKAKLEGIDTVQVCTALTESVSCDLVTEAGAKGRLVKVLESEKSRMAKPKKLTKAELEAKKVELEAKKKALEAERKMIEDGAADDGEGDDGDDGEENPDHDDEDEDKELIKSMLSKYVGGPDHSDEECQAMKQALEHAKEMGLEGKEAEACAGHAMKMAKHVAAKEAKAKEEAAAAAPSGKDTPAPAGDPGKGGDPAGASKEKKESARIAKLEAELESLRLEKHIEKTIRESGLKGAQASKLRECLVKAKTINGVSTRLSVFKEALSVSSTEDGVFNPERTDRSDAAGVLSFEDCVETE